MSDINQQLDALSPQKRKLLEALLKERQAQKGGSHAIPRRAPDAPLPLSFGQQRMWFLDQWEPGSPAYNLPQAVQLRGALNVAAFAQSLNAVVQRHEALRTTFPSVEGAPQQVIASRLTLPLPVVDLQTFDRAAQTAEIERLMAAEAREPFDLANGPLLRARLLQLGPTEHIVLLTMHHIVSDGWSNGVLVREIAALYQAFTAGQPNPLPELPLQYADYAIWQRAQLQGPSLERHVTYWREQLQDAQTVLELPTDHPRPATLTFRGARHYLRLTPELSAAVQALSQREGASLFMTLLAAFKTLLHRYTGQTDLLVGSPVANRTRPELETLIGFFVNTLVLRTNLAGDPSFRSVLQQVRGTTLGAYDHQDLPFEQLVDELHLQRDLSHSPLFQAMFVLQNAPMSALQAPGMTITPLDIDGGTTLFDLMLELYEDGDQIVGSFRYNTDLFEPSTVSEMAGHLSTLLAGIVADPDQPISSLPLLTAAEQTTLLKTWNNTAIDYAISEPLHRLIAAQASRTPEAVAVVFEDSQLSYAALDHQANQLAHHLRSLGIGPDQLVGVCLERSTELVITLLGILKAGAAYVPLDPTYPTQRLAMMISDAQLGVVVTDSAYLDLLPSGPHLVEWSTARPTLAALPTSDPLVPVAVDHAAYAIYTSGSTGTPKGAINSHRAITNRLLWMQQAYQLTAADRVLQKTPFSFDVSVWEFFWPLLAGATLVVARPEGHKDSAYLVELIQQHAITTLHFVPSMLQVFAETANVGACTSLRRVICSGEALSYELQERFFARLDQAELHNLYGPTEAAVDVSFWACQRTSTRPIVPIGFPIANIQLLVLDRNLNLVPRWVPGELHIGGVGLAHGYLNRPALTAEKFVPHPWSAEPGARLYKTGDLVRYLPEGALEYLGRIDQQVKLRGFRIELGEIEAALMRYSGVREAVVLAREDQAGDKRLVAYVVTDQPIALTELRTALARDLPDYMLPNAVVTLEKLPVTSNGKLDRRALPAPDSGRPELSSTFVGARNAVEDVLAGIWASMLELDRVGVYDNFFELGGHSLLATQVMSRVSASFEGDLPLRLLFEAPTVAQLALRVEAARHAQKGRQAPPIVPVKREGGLPLSFAQKRLWFIDQLTPGNPAYNVPPAVLISGPLDVAVLEQCVNIMAHRHEAFSTTFVTIKNQPVQLINPPQPLRIQQIDLRDLPAAEREARARQLTTEEAQRPFDLTTGPLLRVTLVRLDEQEYLLMLTTHHIIYDAMSGMAFVREMRTLYETLLNGETPALPPLPIQYADFAHWQQNWLRGPVLEEHLGYWQHQLADAQLVLDLPSDRPRPAIQRFEGGGYPMALTLELTKALKDLSHKTGTTLYMVMLAAFKTLLYRYTGQTDLVVGSPIANRNRHEIESLIGFFVNTLVLRTKVDGNPSFRELLHRVRETALGAYAHQDLPLEMLVEAIRPERDPSRNPIFQVMFGYLHNYMVPINTLGDLKINLTRISREAAQFDLSLDFWETQDGIRGGFEYSVALFDRATIERMAQHVYTLLQAIVDHPDQPIDQLPMMSLAEREELLVAWQTPAAAFSDTATIHERFAAQAARTPEAVAVMAGNEQLTYAELDQRSSQLAHHLQALGVGPDDLVGLSLPRSLELIIGLLGILKAGGAYVPLDPSYPAERLTVMAQDAGLKIIVTTAELATQVANTGAQLVQLDHDQPVLAALPTTAPTQRASASNLAYVIYTSGSTGTPKGVLTPHRALVNYTEAAVAAYDLSASDRVLQFASISFDASAEEIYPALTTGATLVLRSEAMISSAQTFAQTAQSWGITVLDLPTAYWHELTSDPAALDLLRSSGVRLVLIGGERAMPERLAVWQEHIAGTIRLVNTYGPTEATIVATFAELTKLPAATSTPLPEVPIGRGVRNLQVYVLDHNLQPVPVGVPGELFVGGVGVAHGYLNRPALTAEKFVPDPWSTEPGARLYRTGDLVRYRADGQLQYVGRSDDQVKLRGFRIELREIEAVLAQHSAVREAVVIVREDEPGAKRLVAYVVAQAEAEVVTSELRTHLKAALPAYMIPAAFVVLDTLPITAQGKINRRALPQPDQQRPELDSAFEAPRNAVEEVLAGMCAEALGLEQVGLNDNFFELGGHSLLATQLASQIRETFQVELPLQRFFQAPTVANLSELMLQDPAERSRIEKTADLMIQLAAMSDEELDLLEADEPVA